MVSNLLFCLIFLTEMMQSFKGLLSLLQADYLQETSLLMAKLCYVEGEYRDALGKPHSLWPASVFILIM